MNSQTGIVRAPRWLVADSAAAMPSSPREDEVASYQALGVSLETRDVRGKG